MGPSDFHILWPNCASEPSRNCFGTQFHHFRAKFVWVLFVGGVFVSEGLSVFFGRNVINCNVEIVINTVRSKMLVRLPKFGHF